MPRQRKERRPPRRNVKLSYETVMVKKGGSIVYQCIEKPTGSIICENFFKEDTDAITKHQNKHKHQHGVLGLLLRGQKSFKMVLVRNMTIMSKPCI